jgi:hypothetical protein
MHRFARALCALVAPIQTRWFTLSIFCPATLNLTIKRQLPAKTTDKSETIEAVTTRFTNREILAPFSKAS